MASQNNGPIERMKAEILAYVTGHPHTSFAELDRIEGFSGGDVAWFVGGNLLIWSGMTDTGAAAMAALRAEDAIELHPCDTLIYLIDGKIPSLPVAKRVPAGGYKKEHWLPCTITLWGRGGEPAKKPAKKTSAKPAKKPAAKAAVKKPRPARRARRPATTTTLETP